MDHSEYFAEVKENAVITKAFVNYKNIYVKANSALFYME